MGYFYAQDAAAAAVGLRTQADWRMFIEVIRRNTPPYWRYHSEFESTANECLAEAIRCFNPDRGVPFEGFLAHVARRRVPEVLRRFARWEECASTDEDWMGDYLAQRGDQPDSVAPQSDHAFDHAESMNVVRAFVRPLTRAETQIVLMLAIGLALADVARNRGVVPGAVSNAIARIRIKRNPETLRAA